MILNSYAYDITTTMSLRAQPGNRTYAEPICMRPLSFPIIKSTTHFLAKETS